MTLTPTMRKKKRLIPIQNWFKVECAWMTIYINYAGIKLPRRYGEFPLEMAHTPIVDIDPYYANKKTFMVINKEGTINRLLTTQMLTRRFNENLRFSATNALWLLSPFHPIRRIALIVFTHPMFSFAIITTILVNCKVMTMPESE